MTAARMVLEIVAYLVGGLLLLASSYGCWRARERITDWGVNFWGPGFGDDDRTRWAARMGTYGIISFIAFCGVMCVFSSIGLVLVWMFNGI
jgi:hypothetical protein